MQAIETDRLVLEPLTEAHAERMFEVLSEALLHRYLDRPPPPSLEHLRASYARLETRKSPDGSQQWLNWVFGPKGEPPVGFVQATVMSGRAAWVAYLLSSTCWGRGYASEATQGMLAHLADAYGVRVFRATVEAENERSIRLLERLAFRSATAEELEGRRLAPSERLFVKHVARGEEG